MDKRGITTVMIGVLLGVLVFVIGILAYFFFFGPPVAEAECEIGTGMHILSLAGKEDICYDSARKEIHVTIENGAVVPLEGLYVLLRASTEQKLFLEEVIGKAGVYIGKIAYDLEKEGPLQAIQLFPVALVEDEPTACLDEVLEWNRLEPCVFG